MSVLSILMLVGLSLAQSAPNCPLWGPVYPPPIHVSNSTAVPKAASNLKATLESALQNGTLGAPNTSFHLSVFSTDEVILDFSYLAPGQNSSLTAGRLDRNTIFRTGSMGKFLTVYALLASTGLKYLDDPITKWIPELSKCNTGSVVDSVRWQDITVGSLAGHMAGLIKDFSLYDLAQRVNATLAEQLGLPDLSPSEIPTCGTDIMLPACTREQFFSAIQKIRPVTSAFNMPVYANPTFQLLAYAMEAMTNKSFVEIVESSLIRPLNLNSTYVTTPASTEGLSAIIPGDEIQAWWKLPAGDGTSAGMGLTFSSGADFTAIGQSVLSSTLLSPEVTRKWMKPTAHTPDLRNAVGLPWEIFRIDVPVVTSPGSPPVAGSRITDLYTKNGGVGAYFAQFVLSPDHGLGYVLFVAGLPPTEGGDTRFHMMQLINEMTTQAFVPSFEAAGLEQATENFAGTYRATDNSSMALTIVAGDGGLGLGVQDWKLGDIDLLQTYFAAIADVEVQDVVGEPRLRLYPVNLSDGKQVAFRGVYESPGNTTKFSVGGQPFIGGCGAWAAVAEPAYGNVGLDDFVFEVDSAGKATAITARGARKTLTRQA